MHGKHEVDMTVGSLPVKMIKFAVPFVLMSMLQLTFNAADNLVVGAFAGTYALASVSSSGPITNFVVNLFSGLAVGTNMILTKAIGAGNKKSCEDTVHTTIALGAIVGMVLAILGFLLAPWVVELVNMPKEVAPLAISYLRIYFLGTPGLILYNFSAAILRSMGDTKRPMFYLLFAGILNVVLNLIFVIRFHMSSAGVAIATTISQYVSAVLTMRALAKEDGYCKLYLSKIRLTLHRAALILKLGIPASVQGLMFSISNITIQGCLNTFGADAMAGYGASSTLTGFIYATLSAMQQTALAFTGQNYGAHKLDRIKKIYPISLGYMFLMFAIVAGIMRIFCKPIINMFVPGNEAAMGYAMEMFNILGTLYFICGIMDVNVGMIRGLGKSFVPTIISIVGICGIRLVWICTVFKIVPTLTCLYMTYPVTWIVTGVAQMIYLYRVYKGLVRKQQNFCT